MSSSAVHSLNNYYLLGRSGLRVSPLCLGTMTFGDSSTWGNDYAQSKGIFARYIEAGGNFIDTANGYTGGQSEEYIGRLMQEMGNRDRLVLATKYTFCTHPGDPNAGGNARKNMMQAVEASLQRLQTDYIDLYWMHAWDTMTPVDEVMRGLNHLVDSGKVRYIGFSDVPAWYLGRAQTLAEWDGWAPLCALQLEYSLAERNIEFEFVPAAHALGLGICPWSPLASGLLSGKYTRESQGASGEGRLKTMENAANPVFQKFSERNWKIVDVLKAVAEKLGKSPAQVALNWVTTQPGTTSTIIGATKMSQLEDNLASLEFTIPAELRRQLDDVSAPELRFPYVFFTGHIHNMMHNGVTVRAEPPTYRG